MKHSLWPAYGCEHEYIGRRAVHHERCKHEAARRGRGGEWSGRGEVVSTLLVRHTSHRLYPSNIFPRSSCQFILIYLPMAASFNQASHRRDYALVALTGEESGIHDLLA